MAVPFKASHETYAVGPVYEGLEHMDRIDPARTGHLDDLHRCGIGKPHRTCQVRRSVSSVFAAKSNDLYSYPLISNVNRKA